MSTARFAPITGALLAAKGEARPWGMPDAADQVRPDAVVFPPLPPRPAPVSTACEGALHRCTIRVSAHDFQRLGIVAVKENATRQHLLQQALADYLATKEREYRRACHCMAAAPCGACDTP